MTNKEILEDIVGPRKFNWYIGFPGLNPRTGIQYISTATHIPFVTNKQLQHLNLYVSKSHPDDKEWWNVWKECWKGSVTDSYFDPFIFEELCKNRKLSKMKGNSQPFIWVDTVVHIQNLLRDNDADDIETFVMMYNIH